ncbi:hypothetical protein AVEN_136353-1 [Araneus ventricosus]|uniref:Uncharacterized protein n=1 Tax=Araneus ventricosus TaxID=182803 RepID=A0A4Y2E1I7_ARAVE|nr:hypothetical protein AVEN_136353-1 [Araneus ventricosus]
MPGHCGLVHCGNEQADFLAKRGANLLQHPNTATSYWKIKLFLKNLCTSNSLRDLQTRTALKCWRRVSPSSIPDKPRRDAVATFRLTTQWSSSRTCGGVDILGSDSALGAMTSVFCFCYTFFCNLFALPLEIKKISSSCNVLYNLLTNFGMKVFRYIDTE